MSTLSESLLLLGFSTYEEYLRSELWKKIRLRVLRKSKHRCKSCYSSNNLQVHHTKYGYKHMAGIKKDGFFVLCGDCHKKVHDVQKKKRTGLMKSTKYVINSISKGSKKLVGKYYI